MELRSSEELELLMEMRDGYQEVHRMHEVRKKEFGRDKLLSKIHRDLYKK